MMSPARPPRYPAISPMDDAGDQSDHRSACANQERDARTDEDAAEHVAAEVVGAHDAGAVFKVEPGRLGERVAQVDGDGVMRGQQGAEDGHECEN